MIRTIDIDINAANPNLPLAPFQAFVTSPSSVRIRNVPRKIGAWELTGVALAVNYPDNTLRTAVCKLTAGVWVGTVVGSASVGSSVNGYAIIASGTDENGNGITGYILGKGDVLILATDGTITIGETTYYVHLVDTQPTAPKKGDLCKIGDVYKVYNGSVWESLSGVSSVSWDDITGKPSTFSPSAHASSHGSTGSDPITPAAIGADSAGAAATAKAEAIAACDPAGSASGAVATHDASQSAHASLFAGKQGTLTAGNNITITTHGYSYCYAFNPEFESENPFDFDHVYSPIEIPIDETTYNRPGYLDVEMTQRAGHFMFSDPSLLFVSDDEFLAFPINREASRDVPAATNQISANCDPAGAAATAKAEAIAACDPAGSASGAVATHDASQSAHASLFAGKEAEGTAASLISTDVTHAKSISATGVSAVCTPDSNGNVDVSTLFSSANTSLMGTVRYATAAATTALADRTCNAVTITSSAVTLTFPAAVSGKMRDFLVYIDASGFAEGGSLTITLPSGAAQYGDDFPAITAAGEHLLAVTEIAADTFFVKALEIEEVS